MARDLCNFLHRWKPTMVMVLVQIIYAGINVFYKLANRDGMNLRILIAYRYIFATLFLAPVAFFLERNSRPKLTWTIIFQAFLCGLLGGTMAQNLYLTSLSLTSMTFAAAMINLISAITYIIAVTLGMERFGIRTMVGKAKLVGTIIGIGGAMVLTFYKGSEVNLWSTNIDLTRGLGNVASTSASHAASGDRVLGSLLALASCFCSSLWLIIQTKWSNNYPCHLSSTTLMCIMGSIQSTIFSLCVERKWKEWKLGWNIRLWTVAYTGILASGVMFTMVAWAVRAKGPLFVSVFNPLMLVLVAIIGSLLLAEKLHVGSLVGATLIVLGLYMVLWGKGKEMKRMSQLMPSKSSRESQNIEVVITTNTSSSSPTDDDSNHKRSNIELSSSSPHNLATVNLSAATREAEDEEEKEGPSKER